MKQKNKFLANILLATTFLTSQTAIAAHTPKVDFTNVISFGDSFVTPKDGWAALMTERYGFKFVNGENNFFASTTFDLAKQYEIYKANGGKIDPHALIQAYTGVNDMILLMDHVESYTENIYRKGYQDIITNNPHVLPSLDEIMHEIIDSVDFEIGEKQLIEDQVLQLERAGMPDDLIRDSVVMTTFDLFIKQGYNIRAINSTMSSLNIPIPDIDQNLVIEYASQYMAKIAEVKADWVKTLHSDGAKHIVFLNHYNSYYSSYNIPADTPEERKALGEDITTEYNKAMYEAMDRIAPDANVTLIDYDRLVAEISNNPNTYLSEQDIAGTYNDWGFVNRGSHPTPAAQKITAQLVASVLEAPGRVAMVRELPIAVGTNALQTIHATAHNSVLHPTEQFYTSEIGGDYIYNNTKLISKKELGIKKANTGVAHAIINYKINENFTLGLQLNGAKSNMKFQKDHGKADIKEYLVSINGTYKFDNPVFIYAAFGVGQIKYDIQRKIRLGLATIEEKGKPSGVHYIGTVGVGYNYVDASQLVVTPFVNVNYQEVSLKKYKEIGGIRSTTMEFNIPNRKSLMPEVGVTISQDCKVQDNLTLTPSLSLSYGHECINSIKKEAKIKVTDIGRTSSLPTYKVDASNFMVSGELRAKNDTYLSYGIRASMQLTKNAKQYSAGLFAGFTF